MKLYKVSRHNQRLIKTIKAKYPHSFLGYTKEHAIFAEKSLKRDPFARSGVEL